MKTKIFLAISSMLIGCGWVVAQSVPLPPTPVAESDLRDNTIKMRSIDLERVKRDAAKKKPEELTREQEIRFAQTKENFESIQKSQDRIIKAYTTGNRIDYPEISRSASKIRKNSLWLDENLFGAKPEEASKKEEKESDERKGVRDLIIELDNSIGRFVKSPIFQDTKVVDSKTSEAAQLELRNIIMLSDLLSLEAAKMK